MKFSFEKEKNRKLSLLDVEVSRERNKFATTIYGKPTFSSVYTRFDSFLPTTYKFSMIYILFFRCYSICSNLTNFHNEVVFLKNIFLKTLVLPFFGKLSLQTRTKLQKVLKRTLSCSKIQIVLKNQINLSNVLRFKDRIPYDLMSCVVYKFPIMVKLTGT